MLPLRARHAAARRAAVAEGAALDAVPLADVAARHEVEDEAEAGEAVHDEVEDAGRAAALCGQGAASARGARLSHVGAVHLARRQLGVVAFHMSAP